MKRMSTKQKRELKERLILCWGHSCMYCGDVEVDLQLEHILPIARGGQDIEDNLVIACRECNLSKGKRLLQDWSHLAFIEVPKWLLDQAGVQPEPWHSCMVRGHPNYGNAWRNKNA